MQASKSSYHFGPYRLDASQRVLLRDGKPVSLTLKAFDTLMALVQKQGHVVEKDDLMKLVWPDACVEDSNLTQNIFTLRKVLGETAEGSKYIETVPRRGYRFIAPVDEVLEVPSTIAKTTESYQAVGQTLYIPGSRTTRFLAVLPFINVSNDSETEYLSDGITESIINSLAQLPLLRVMSRSTVFRYKSSELDAQRIGRELGVDAVLVGRVHSYDQRLVIGAELVDVANGWQLWGESYDHGAGAIFEVQDEIARQISAALRLRLSGEEERRLAKRHTRSTEAYQFYLKGRFHWSKYTKEGLEQAIDHFRQAIDLDPNYALAYAGIVDCYLRLATNYIPPADALPRTRGPRARETDDAIPEAQPFPGMFKVRQEWDRKAAERESKRAIELKSVYPAAHQWHAAYLFSAALYRKAAREMDREHQVGDNQATQVADAQLPNESRCADLTPAEEVQVFCTVAREQIEAGNFEAACAVLQRWWTIGEWPKVEGLEPHPSADLLFTTGTLAGWLASSRQVPKGQKHAEALLNGSIALFEQLGLKTRGAEGRIELAYCYYREGLFDLARSTLQAAILGLPKEEPEVRSMGLIRLSVVECDAGRLQDSLQLLSEVAETVEVVGPWVTGRYHLELATTLKDLGVAETRTAFFDLALGHYQQALYEFEAIGNHRLAATVENNHGYLLLALQRLDEAQSHLIRARRLFDGFADKARGAQVDETLAQLHLAAERPDQAEQAIRRAVQRLLIGGEEALLAEALTTQGVVLCRLGRQGEGKRVLERASRVAESCGDNEGAGRALLILIEEMSQKLDDDERLEIASRLEQLLGDSQKALILERLRRCLAIIAEAAVRNDSELSRRFQK
ncbi:MAG: winged helix-turn-helix domain-containing protein [Pyrinomonadaceae bacterium]|nr:winged helix-turn-helix domain-containing protein [Pyrinomonadaceae bacterium]MDQ3173530.1 winged helix-turn-helix domain-containing protein [Acidobacteriota bacterium]